jgi:hypothetical protein
MANSSFSNRFNLMNTKQKAFGAAIGICFSVFSSAVACLAILYVAEFTVENYRAGLALVLQGI